MYRLTMLYGHPEDPAAFDEHYRRVHAPLGARVPGVRGYTMNFCESGPDGSKPAYHLIAILSWDSREAMQAALESPEFKAAADDLSTSSPWARK
jgi:uncharacterized protein (TIGR02118 family)